MPWWRLAEILAPGSVGGRQMQPSHRLIVAILRRRSWRLESRVRIGHIRATREIKIDKWGLPLMEGDVADITHAYKAAKNDGVKWSQWVKTVHTTSKYVTRVADPREFGVL